MGLAYDPDLGPEPAAPDDATSADELGNNLLLHAATLLCGKPVFGAADPIRIKDTPTPMPRRIGSADIEQVASTTKHLSQLASDLGGIPMTAALTAHARASEALLGADMREPIRQQLLVALADVHRAAGIAAADAGLRELARQHFTRGMDCAGSAGDPLRAVVSMDWLGQLELDVEPNEALKLFQLGAATAPSPLPRVLLQYHCAGALGLLGLEREAVAALRGARDTYQAAGDEPQPWKNFAAALPHFEGCAYLALGHFDRATLAFAAAVDGMKHAVMCSMDNLGHLAAAQLRCGELRSGLHTARRDSTCRDLARELAMLRSAA